MQALYFILSILLVLTTLIPFVPNQHWFFRGFDFGKLQFLVLQIIVFTFGWLAMEPSAAVWAMQFLLLVCLLYNAQILVKYTPFYRVKEIEILEDHSDSVTLLSANVFQFNTDYQRFIRLVEQTKPDIVLTMESNQDWENALTALEKDYPNHCKVPLENTYGIHLYTKLNMDSCQVHYFVADDLPCIEASLHTRRGDQFVLFGVHPPPPSPTEEANSKERDGELLSVAKKIRKDQKTTVVVGDFNNVAWAKSSVLFRKTSETVDPRIGRGLISTFHAKYWFLRFPIDQLYHTTDLFIQELKVLPDFGSDHLPLFCQFYINRHDPTQEDLVESLEKGDMKEVNTMIADGIAEQSERRNNDPNQG